MTVWLCSGQGAQKPGMGADLLDLPAVADTFAVMSDALGLDLAHLAREGSQDDVNGAVAAQGLTMAVSVAGQMAASAVVDHYGLFGVPVVRWSWRRLPACGLILGGLALMLW